MNTRLIRLSSVILCAGLLAACANNPRHAPVYEENSTWSGQRAGMQYGVIRSIEDVSSRENTSGAGALIGGVVGAVVGRQIGSGSGRTAGTIVGAVGGAIAANEIERHNTQPAGRYRVQVEIDGGQVRTFNLAQLGDLKPGDRVVVDGQSVRRY